MKYLKIIFYIIITLLLLNLVYFFSVWLWLSEPWKNVRVSKKESLIELETKQKLNILYKNTLVEVLRKKDSKICGALPEQAYTYARDKDGKIIYTFLSTTGGPTGPHRTFSFPKSQCEEFYLTNSNTVQTKIKSLDWNF